MTNFRPFDWKSQSLITDGLEKVVGSEDFQEPWFLAQGAIAARSVCMIPNLGTGFLISKNMLLTNNHVFPSPDWAKDINVVFNYENQSSGIIGALTTVKCRPDILFITEEEHDFTILALDGVPGDTFNYIDITRPGKITLNSRANIIQHPGAGLKKIAIRNNELRYFDNFILQYATDTEHGSSGSPVFDDQWKIIGLHNSYKEIDNSGQYYNQATNIAYIGEKIKNLNFFQANL